VHWGLVIVFILLVAIAAIALVSWAFHYMSPVAYHYLSGSQLDKIEAVMFGGIISIIAQALSKKI